MALDIYKKAIKQELKNLYEDALENIKTEADVEAIKLLHPAI